MNIMKRDIKVLLAQVERKLVRRMHERPSAETLNHLALFVGFQDWDSFQRELHETIDEDEDDGVTEQQEHDTARNLSGGTQKKEANS